LVVNDVTDLATGLQGFGLTEYESRVYIALLENGPSTVNQLQYSSSVPRTKVYPIAIQLAKKGVVKAIEGKPIRFQAEAPEIFQSAILAGEKRVKAQKRVLGSLKKVMEKNILPHDIIDERYLSLGSQSILMKLKEAMLRTQSSVRCIVDGWGLHLIQECSEELETICRQDVDIMILSAVPPSPVDFQFSSSKMKVRYGQHISGRSVFIFDNAETMVVNSQTGRGYIFLLNELRAIIGDTLFSEYWKTSTSRKTLGVVSSIVEEDTPALLDSNAINGLFIEAVSKSITDDKLLGAIGAEFLRSVEERLVPRLRRETFENSVRLVAALVEHEVGEGANAEFDQLTKILRIEIPDTQGRIPSSVWFFALAGLLARTGAPNEVLQNTTFAEAKSRVIQTKILSPK
jgi:sugar-specific transcriptional regulator TrmB